MKYQTADIIQFEYQIDKYVPIRETVAIGTYPQTMKINLKQGDILDEISSRTDVYGDNAENQSYLIFEANVIAIVDSKFDLSKIKSLKVPII
jgi:hypothetical protein